MLGRMKRDKISVILLLHMIVQGRNSFGGLSHSSSTFFYQSLATLLRTGSQVRCRGPDPGVRRHLGSPGTRPKVPPLIAPVHLGKGPPGQQDGSRRLDSLTPDSQGRRTNWKINLDSLISLLPP